LRKATSGLISPFGGESQKKEISPLYFLSATQGKNKSKREKGTVRDHRNQSNIRINGMVWSFQKNVEGIGGDSKRVYDLEVLKDFAKVSAQSGTQNSTSSLSRRKREGETRTQGN